MKKSLIKLLSVLTVIMLAFSFTACGGSGSGDAEETGDEPAAEAEATDELAGRTYELESSEIDGMDQDLGAIQGRQLIFNNDGTYTLKGYRDDETEMTVKDQTGEYTVNGDEAVLTYVNDPSIYVFDDGTTMDEDEDTGKTMTETCKIEGDKLVVYEEVADLDDEGNETDTMIPFSYTYQLVQ